METKKSTTDILGVITLKDVFFICLEKWYWWVMSVIVCLLLAGLKIITTAPVYTRSATVLIKETNVRRASSSDIDMMMATAGAAGNTSKLVNEIVAFKSPELMKEVVNRLNLDISYAVSGRTYDITYFDVEVPFEAFFPDDTQSCRFEVTNTGEDDFSISKVVCYDTKGKAIKISGTFPGSYGDTLSLDFGRLVLKKRALYQGEFKHPVKVNKCPKAAMVQTMLANFTAKEVDLKNKSDVLYLVYNDVNISRADNILNMVINIYNENWVNDKNKMAISTSAFITERLDAIEKDLTAVDSDISDFKSKNLIPDLKSVSSMYITRGNEVMKGIRELENELYVAKYVRGFLQNSVSDKDLIPMASSFSNQGLAKQIDDYNTLLLNKKVLVANSSEENPVVKDIDATLKIIRQSVYSSVESQIKSIETQLQYMEGQSDENKYMLAKNPDQAKFLMTIERQQKVKENLYVYLLQKREENELSQAFAAYNTRVITPPYGLPKPTAPNKQKIFFLAFILGLVIPVVVVYFKDVLNTKLRGRSDIAALTVPFLGEIPLKELRHKEKASKLKFWEKPVDQHSIVVKAGKRDIINEAFRVLRANLEFTLKGQEHTVLITASFNPGSGKTFLAVNLGSAFAIKKKKVLIIDGDMRHASLSTFADSPNSGLSNYLAGQIDDVHSVVVQDKNNESLFFLPVGTIPPNPAELLGDAKFADMINMLKQEYYMVIIDCPPVDIVADTQIVSALADRTIFVVRSGLMERSMLPIIQVMYDENKYPNMMLVLNGTKSSGLHGSYSYQYGYYGGKGYYANNNYVKKD